jgi:hypothetical protein
MSKISLMNSRKRTASRTATRLLVGALIQASAVATEPASTIAMDDLIGRSFSCSAPVSIQAAAGDDANALPRFDIVAYNGGKMNVGWGYPVVVDLAGIKIDSQANPVRYQHDPTMGVGHTESVRVEGNRLLVSGVVSRETESAREVVASSKKGFPWQASIGATPGKYRFVQKDETAFVNGQTQAGPFYHVLESSFDEVSFVDLGADRTTSARIAAADEGTPKETIAGANTQTPPASQPGDIQAAITSAVSTAVAQVQAESQRIAAITSITSSHPEIQAKALAEKWSAEKAELAVLRASRPSAPGIHVGSGGNVSGDILQCAVLQASGKDGIEAAEKEFDDKTLQAAHSHFRGRMALQMLFLQCAWANGYSGYTFAGNERDVLRAAFGGGINANANYSTISVGGILSNTANKFLLQGFMTIEQAWRQISAIRSVNDFKEITSYRLTGAEEYQLVPATGELKNGTLGEEKYGNKADTYGLMLSITRTDFRNDDLGAFTMVPQKLGRGAGLKINKVFWTEFMNDGAFFTTGNKNYFEGAGSVLSIDQMTIAVRMFNDQTDSNGDPIGVEPKILLVPNALDVLGRQIYTSLELRPIATSKEPTSNPHAGMYRPVRSAYLSNANIAGNSTTAWRLLADPAELATIETCFLDGNEQPIIETAEADFNTLGVQMRGYHDFGVRKQDYRAGVKSKGAA